MNEIDPNGFDAHQPGSKLDAGKLRVGLVLMGFSRAITAVAQVGTYGAAKYTDNGWVEVPDGQRRYTDAMFRHLLAETHGVVDEETGLLHAAQAAWNALARLDLYIREKERIDGVEKDICDDNGTPAKRNEAAKAGKPEGKNKRVRRRAVRGKFIDAGRSVQAGRGATRKRMA